ncbi:P-loop-containing nucleoside triphosphate hydrolase [Chloropicon roscoffensis]|uniref:P-loop-containing nucleoside triphosphate hydrolase n=2 Tax=Chloropicon roscoffensis TaxID=1461544 RepID=A0AAX4NY54_9CHLO
MAAGGVKGGSKGGAGRARRAVANQGAGQNGEGSQGRGAAEPGTVGSLDEPGTSERRLVREVLSWDFLHLLRQDKHGSEKAGSLPHQARLVQIPSTFSSIDAFENCYEPLLLEETRATLMQGWKSREYLLYQCAIKESKIVKTEEGDEFVECRADLVGDNLCPDDHSAAARDEDAAFYSAFPLPRDIVLMTRENPILEGNTAVKKCYFLAYLKKHDDRNPRTLTLTVLARGHYRGTEANEARDDQVRRELCAGGIAMVDLGDEDEDETKGQGGDWFISRIATLTTLVREHKAVFSLRNSSLAEEILDPSASAPTFAPKKIPDRLLTRLARSHNEDQLKALLGAVKGGRFHLIKGPPGTGKTSTLCGLLAVLCQSHGFDYDRAFASMRIDEAGDHRGGSAAGAQARRQKWLKASPWVAQVDPRKTTPESCLRVPKNEVVTVESSREGAPRVLVCTPNNAALDEVCVRVAKTGLKDELGYPFHPKIVRVGVKHQISEEARPYSLDLLAKRRAEEGRGSDREVLREVLRESQIVFSTLTFADSTTIRSSRLSFDYIIVDEAAQAVEPTCLIPLVSFGFRKCFLVGDPAQLPATVLSKKATELEYRKSLFERLQSCGHAPLMLTRQYRMHPEIREWPSKKFYHGKLVDAEGLEEALKRPWHQHDGFGPYNFYDIKGGATQNENSWRNQFQADFAAEWLSCLLAKYPNALRGSDVGVIGTYKDQVDVLREKLRERLGEEFASEVEVLSVDAFQGREKDVIIWTTVRTEGKEGRGSIGFVSDRNRMCVGLTRAKSTLVVVGDGDMLGDDSKEWWELVNRTRRRGFLHNIKKPFAMALEAKLNGNRVTKGQTKRQRRDGAKR